MLKLGKVIIVEGLDRTGKDTQITLLENYFKSKNETFLQLHFGKPMPLEKEEMIFTSKNMFKNTFEFMLKSLKLQQNFILNRFHIGEAVYAPLYRNYSGNYVFSIEKKYCKKFIEEWNNVYLITFTDTPEHFIEREDGNSFSKNKGMKKKEIKRFVDSTQKSNIKNKIIINIDGKSIEQVQKEVFTFLGL
jgi:thymidylate kinase